MRYFMALGLLIGATCIYFASVASIEALAKQANQISLEKEMQIAGNSKTDKSNLPASQKKPKAGGKVINYKISTKDDFSAFLIDVKFQGHSLVKLCSTFQRFLVQHNAIRYRPLLEEYL